MKQKTDMVSDKSQVYFSTLYGEWKKRALEERSLRERPELELQTCWQQREWPEEERTLEGHRIRVISPGWWNKLKGPDFINAQIEFNGELVTGDVEIHCKGRDWFHHGHQNDPAYNNVILHVVEKNDETRATKASGEHIATWVFPVDALAVFNQDGECNWQQPYGKCTRSLAFQNPRLLEYFLDIAGDWRIREKKRRFSDREDEVGYDQALYESILEACGYSHFKKEFVMLGRVLPYERALQLCREDPQALEAAYLRLAGFLPREWPYENLEPPSHYKSLIGFYEKYLHPLDSLEINWKKQGVRPANKPERRLVGMTRFMTAISKHGLKNSLYRVWRQNHTIAERQEFFHSLFRKGMGFWDFHFSWDGKKLERRQAIIGEGRGRSILGNILIPAGLALAYNKGHDSLMEKRVHEFFSAMPSEPSNRIYRTMLQWIVPDQVKLKMNFRRQQGLLQLHSDWCERNPSCQNCILPTYLEVIDEGWNIPASLTQHTK